MKRYKITFTIKQIRTIEEALQMLETDWDNKAFYRGREVHTPMARKVLAGIASVRKTLERVGEKET